MLFTRQLTAFNTSVYRTCAALVPIAMVVFALTSLSDVTGVLADGKVVPPRDYAGSLEERAQEALIIFHEGDKPGAATEDLILKIQVTGQVSQFAWIIPFPQEPKVEKEDPQLFRELFDYVELRHGRDTQAKSAEGAKAAAAPGRPNPVEVLSRQIVGTFDVAVVRETEQGGLNPWLVKEGFQKLENAEDVLKFYRQKKYVFACIKVSSDALKTDGAIESHPLRFTFKTGGRDGIYFPMKLTGLQKDRFDVNLYVLYRYWLNDKLTKYGYEHRGFNRVYRDWDTKQCVPNGGKQYSLPQQDPFLKDYADGIPLLSKLLQKLHPGEPYYLTNIKAIGLKPEDVRSWSDDLWLFPYYTNRSFIPYDARPGGVADGAWSQP